MSDQPLQPIIVKKIKKVAAGHTGGAWKIAYADFVTAMMAFFLLLWLLNSVTQEQLEGIADHFAPVSVSQQASGSGDILGGKVAGEEGAMEVSSAAVSVDLPPPSVEKKDTTEETEAESDVTDEQMKEKEEEQFKEAEDELNEAMKSIPSLKRLKDSLMVDNTPEGLRIQIVDQKGLAMFPSGSSKMYLHTRKLLELVTGVIINMPQKLAISGHTDAVPFTSDTGYSNWELSSDRANAVRRELVGHGVPFDRIGRVVGKAATEPLLKDDPKDAKNRRLSIIMLRGTGHKKPAAEAATTFGEAPPESPPESPSGVSQELPPPSSSEGVGSMSSEGLIPLPPK